jgi:pimeloyl-ACP methyl ester carboxylesterase
MPTPTLAGITAQTITTARLSTRLLSCGDANGTPVIFVHGNVSDATFWEETMLALPKGYRAYAYDQRGYGEADPEKKINATLGLADLADDLAALMDALDVQKAHLVGHSAGGSVLWRFMMDYAERARTVTVVCPGSPYGFGGTKADGSPNFDDFAGTGAGTVNAAFPPMLAAGERGDAQGTPRWTMRSFYFKPPFVSAREEDLLSSMLATHVGEQDYPGDIAPSANWPNVAPGKWGMVNALSPAYAKDPSNLYGLDAKPPVLWVRGVADQIVADLSFFDIATLGKLGMVPGYPGEDVCPPQPMVAQTRDVLEKYKASGGDYEEVALDAGHTPYLEAPEAFNSAFHAFLKKHS